MISMQWSITTFYCFSTVEHGALPTLRAELKDWMREQGMVGLVILATEGINGTVAGSEASVLAFKERIWDQFGRDVGFKDSQCEFAPFQRVVVNIRREIVGMKRPGLVPDAPQNRHLTPEAWHQMLKSDQPKLVIDTRNTYETVAGKFKGAIDPVIENFSEWGAYLDQADLPKDIPLMIYCTGGIRCEKAILELDARGYDNVVQLRDGILGYLAKYPYGYFDGECFVFDERVTVGRDLKPTGNFGLCAASGLTTSEKRTCSVCDSGYFVDLGHEAAWGPYCSKRCRNSVLVSQGQKSG